MRLWSTRKLASSFNYTLRVHENCLLQASISAAAIVFRSWCTNRLWRSSTPDVEHYSIDLAVGIRCAAMRFRGPQNLLALYLESLTYDTWYPTQNAKQDVDEEVGVAAGLEEDGEWREEDRKEVEKYVTLVIGELARFVTEYEGLRWAARDP